MELTKKQTTEVISNFLKKENGLNDVLEMVLNGIMLAEREVFLKEGSTQKNKGNGFRLGKVFGYGAQIELRIPRDRLSEFMPKILVLFREQESYLKEVSFMLYSKGLTTRDISDVMETIYGTHYSKSTISNISVSFYQQMEAWRNRPLESHYRVIYIDGLFVNVKRNGEYRKECFYIIMGLTNDFKREIIAIENMPTESSTGWAEIFKKIKQRGLNSVGLVVSDGLAGLDNQIAEYFPQTPHQKCVVHLQRSLQSYVRSEDKEKLAEDIRFILDPDNPDYQMEHATQRIEQLIEKWRHKYKSLARHLKAINWQPYFTYLNYDTRIRRMIYSTNWIERFNKSAKRTLKIRGAFPTEESVLALITSVAIDKMEKKYKYPIYNFRFEPKLDAPEIK